ncbi:MAG: DUF5985 family protein [Pseudolabrys sp.]|nr:DUF5985 family protein [Pseudolabrys sp.]
MTDLLATSVYLLCFGTSVACGALLVRSYLSNRSPLLLWTAACFVLLAVTNFLVVVDLVFLPDDVDLRLARYATGLTAIGTLLYGFIWELD